MKKISIVLLLFLFLFSCNNADEGINETSVIGKWNLTKIINTSIGGTMSPSATETHFYKIDNNGTFERVSIENNTVTILNGTFIVKDENSNYGNEDGSIQKFIELSYSSSDAMFFNCGIIETNKQLLILNSDNKLQNTLSGSCDGENYEYTKEK